MEIDGWLIRADQEGNMLRTSHERPKTHYVVTIINRYAIDIEINKQEVDRIPKEDLQKTLVDTIKSIIKTREER